MSHGYPGLSFLQMAWLHRRHLFFVFAALCFIRNSSLFIIPKQHARAKASRQLFGALSSLSPALFQLLWDMTRLLLSVMKKHTVIPLLLAPVRAQCLQLLQKPAICPFASPSHPIMCSPQSTRRKWCWRLVLPGLYFSFSIVSQIRRDACALLSTTGEMRSHSVLISVTHVTLTKLTLKMERSAVKIVKRVKQTVCVSFFFFSSVDTQHFLTVSQNGYLLFYKQVRPSPNSLIHYLLRHVTRCRTGYSRLTRFLKNLIKRWRNPIMSVVIFPWQ